MWSSADKDSVKKVAESLLANQFMGMSTGVNSLGGEAVSSPHAIVEEPHCALATFSEPRADQDNYADVEHDTSRHRILHLVHG